MICFYKVPDDSELGKEYIKYNEFIDSVTKLFKEFAKKHCIKANGFYPSVERLWIEPEGSDFSKFTSDYMADCPGKFKMRSTLNKEWIALCKENGFHKTLYRPYMPFHFHLSNGKCHWRLVDVDETIYCSFESENEFTAPDDIIQIKGSEFYKAIEN